MLKIHIFKNNKRKKINIITILSFILALFYISQYKLYSDKIPVLTFHRLVPEEVKKKLYPDNKWVGSIKIFEKMIKYLYNNGYKTISTEQLYKWYIGEIELKKKTVLISIDDGFYEDYYFVYPIIRKYNYKATSFVVGCRIKNKTPPYNKHNTLFIGLDAINQVRKEYPNYEFQSHSYNMHYYTMTKSGLKNHIINSISYEKLNEDILKNSKFSFTTMAYPYGVYNEKIKDILENNGYLIAFKFGTQEYATRNSDRFAIPRITLNGWANMDTLKQLLKY